MSFQNLPTAPVSSKAVTNTFTTFSIIRSVFATTTAIPQEPRPQGSLTSGSRSVHSEGNTRVGELMPSSLTLLSAATTIENPQPGTSHLSHTVSTTMRPTNETFSSSIMPGITRSFQLSQFQPNSGSTSLYNGTTLSASSISTPITFLTPSPNSSNPSITSKSSGSRVFVGPVQLSGVLFTFLAMIHLDH